jgi:hypothetical protein
MGTPFDAVGKDLFELAPAGWLGVLGHPRSADRVRMIDADLSSTVSTATDKVIFVDDPEPWLLMIELQANWDGDLPYDLMRRFALLRHRHRMPVSCAVVLMRPEANTSAMTGAFPQANPLGISWSFPFSVFRLWEQPVSTFLDGPLGLVPFAPIAQIDPTDLHRIKSIVGQRLISEATPSQSRTLRTAVVELLALRYDDTEIGIWEDLMATLDITATPLIKRLQNEAKLQQSRAALIRIGRKKFGVPPPAEAEATIAAATDLDRLDELMDRVLDVKNWNELMGT